MYVYIYIYIYMYRCPGRPISASTLKRVGLDRRLPLSIAISAPERTISAPERAIIAPDRYISRYL